MDYLLICIVAMGVSGLTLFSGFGLGTLLLPAFVLFFPVQAAVAMTAVVHLANNLFKLFLIGNKADSATLLRFGLPALAAGFAGAWLLLSLADLEPVYSYELWGRHMKVYPVNLVIGLLMGFFAMLELYSPLNRLQISPAYLPLGGVLSGFYGGLSGHQGAFRSAFLLKSGLDKEAFVGTGVVIAVLVDVSRITVYSGMVHTPEIRENLPLIAAAVLAAFAGAFIGRRVLSKITFRTVQLIVGIMLLLVSILLILGVV
ncbi:sulfite exporter TauE/SafE family protein [Desulfonatronospira sp. MSAO_Bac3]|uniref:sulfite exporter TauE/SafE family protein n=1 Tax=Desulfonatronospira sp. MSAO_Bac3 TaxID=2293857 RepID=UPI000FF603B7|nr:sulfite exporter TauE/SafE family protein [Desulfonatronospira sp. MSAO_Bac3]RQD78840.1 MAG: sulfite exporter TauE/SafE family protein [Desulfonatronospira sp. MSAO_Bac3]